MEKRLATRIFECLSSTIRLDAYRMLVRAGPPGMVAGEIASALGLPPANVSFHLKAMSHVGLVAAEQEGRFQRYRANMKLMAQAVAYLTEECCAGHPELCAVPARRRSARSTTRRKAALST